VADEFVTTPPPTTDLDRRTTMEDVLGYRDAPVVVTGAASGMGAAAAQLLVDLGARVTALDIKPTDVAVERFAEVDLRDRAAIETVAASIDEPVRALFSCAGLPGPPFSELDTMLVNFVGARHLAEALVPKMPAGSSITAIASSAAVGWQDQMATIGQLLATDGFDEAVEWLTSHEESWSWSGYLFSKWVVDAWVGWWYADLAGRGLRINCINPGPTDTAMMPAFHDFATKEVVDQAVGPIGRYARADEQAWPLVVLGSPRLSYVAGEVLAVDGGFQGATHTGRQQADWADMITGA
jgi:NAD(P)-dependent dehydrogenase (short-subunit alcohol dehydrogenase family)